MSRSFKWHPGQPPLKEPGVADTHDHSYKKTLPLLPNFIAHHGGIYIVETLRYSSVCSWLGTYSNGYSCMSMATHHEMVLCYMCFFLSILCKLLIYKPLLKWLVFHCPRQWERVDQLWEWAGSLDKVMWPSLTTMCSTEEVGLSFGAVNSSSHLL